NVVGNEIGDAVPRAIERHFDRAGLAVARYCRNADLRAARASAGNIAQESAEAGILQHRSDDAAGKEPLVFECEGMPDEAARRRSAFVAFESDGGDLFQSSSELAPARPFLGGVTPLIGFVVVSAREIEVGRGRKVDRHGACLPEKR